MEANQYLNDFYNHYDEDSRLLFQHGSVEFLTTMRYIEKYLKHGDKVLEIGAGTGRYSHALARRGHPVDAVELVAHNIEVFRQNTRPGESVTIAQGNALDLSAFADNAYDVTLLLGPLYHLYTQDDKRRALREAIRVTKPGGVVFAAYVISDGCLLDEGFRRGNISVAEYVRDGLLDAQFGAADALGIRFHATRGSMDLSVKDGGLPPDSVVQTVDQILKDSERAVKKFHDKSRYSMHQVALAPCSPFSVTGTLLKESAQLARELGVRLHTHLAETKDEERFTTAPGVYGEPGMDGGGCVVCPWNPFH